MGRYKTEDIRNQFIEKYKNNDIRIIGGQKCIEIQNANFIADKDFIIRKPNYDYASREIQWYESQSLYVEDIPGKVPAIWEQCADKDGKINSNYGWCIFSNENGNQYKNCVKTLLKDPYSRQAVMIYNRPSMYADSINNGMHDFMCTFSTQVFLNEKVDDSIPGNLIPYYELDYIVNMRSNDSVFGYNSDYLWAKHVQNKLCKDLSEKMQQEVRPGIIYWNAGSLHVYERHFKYLEN